LRLLALAAQEELAVFELAELLRESQPNVSRHASSLRDFDLLVVRREGTRLFVRLNDALAQDAVVRDAVNAGRAMCEADGATDRVAHVIAAREVHSREFFSQPAGGKPLEVASELGAYLAALGSLLPGREIAVDAGTGDGRLLDVLAPVFARVVAFDRSAAQLALAKERVISRGYTNVELLHDEIDSKRVRKSLGGKADVVFASRVVHHAPKPGEYIAALGELCRPSGGALVVIDYARHDNEAMRAQADVWLGFAPNELKRFARDAGFERVTVTALPKALRGQGIDKELDWQVMCAVAKTVQLAD
jgi:ArsR family transcriptional regulator